MNIQLIIFDLDGVLIDSEILWHTINAEEMTKAGFNCTIEKSIELMSNSIKYGYDKVMLQEYNSVLPETIRKQINIKTEESYKESLKPIKNMAQVLSYLKLKKVKICIGSNADDAYVETTLKITGLDQYFGSNQIFTSERVKKRKPAPDIFLLAAQSIKIKPENCLVIEDHPLGIAAAKAANMQVIGFLGASHANNNIFYKEIIEAKPTKIIDGSLELLEILKSDYDL